MHLAMHSVNVKVAVMGVMGSDLSTAKNIFTIPSNLVAIVHYRAIVLSDSRNFKQ